MELSLENKQSLALSPQGMLSMKILQMNSAQLAEYVEQAWLENPVLEMADGGAKQNQEFVEKVQWLQKKSQTALAYATCEDDEWQPEVACPAGVESLYHHLAEQLEQKNLPTKEVERCHFVMESLNEKGWLDEDAGQLASMMGCETAQMERAICQIQGFHPVGVGARDLQQCLTLQLKAQVPVDTVAMDLVENHLEAVAKGRWSAIAKACQVTTARIQQAVATIRTLQPNPAQEFLPAQVVSYTTPDVAVYWEGDQWRIQLEGSAPQLQLSPLYTQLAREEDQATRAFLQVRMEQAAHLMQSIAQRQENLLRCTQLLLQYQAEFFSQGPGHLVPLDMTTMAEKMEVHPSTVSRIASSKYLQCPMGLFPFAYFFSKKTGDSNVSSDKIKHIIKDMIGGENPEKPFSDQKLCQMLADQNITVSRRAVTKYRESLGIPSGVARKQRTPR